MTVTPARRSRRRLRAVVAISGLVLLASACGSGNGNDAGNEAGTDAASTAPPAGVEAAAGASPTGPLTGTVNLGFFPNVTHAPALVGVEQGLFADALGDGVELNTFTFNAGTEAIEALFAERDRHHLHRAEPGDQRVRAESNGEAIRIVSGSTSGGAYLVVKPEITSARAARRHARSRRRRSATPRTSRSGPGCRAGSRDHARGRRRRDDPPAVERDDARVVRRRRDRRRLGARAVGDPTDPRGRRHRARRRARPVARDRRRVRHDPPDRAHRVPRGAPRPRARRSSTVSSRSIDAIAADPAQPPRPT